MIGVGFVLQAGALRFGQLSSVQPIVTTELLFLVLILGVWFRYRLTWREWAGALAAAGGLAAFLVVAAPGGGSVVPTLRSWASVAVVVGVIVVVTSALGFTGPRWFRASMFGASGAMMFALSAALTKQFTTLVTEGWGHVFTNWGSLCPAGGRSDRVAPHPEFTPRRTDHGITGDAHHRGSVGQRAHRDLALPRQTAHRRVAVAG